MLAFIVTSTAPATDGRMRPAKGTPMRRYPILWLLLFALILPGCGDDDDGGPTPVSPEDAAAANEAAADGMDGMMTAMEDAMGGEFDPARIDELLDVDMAPHAADFEDALALDPDCGPAHFGLAFIGMMSVARDDDLEQIMDDMDAEFGGVELPIGLPSPGFTTHQLLAEGILGRSFEILRRAPLAVAPQVVELGGVSVAKADGPLIRALQTHVHEVMLPRIRGVLAHLEAAESDPDFAIVITREGEDPDTIEFDLGEVYVLDSIVRALYSGLLVATAYDVEPAPDGDYSWLVDNVGEVGYTGYDLEEVVDGPDVLTLYDDEEVQARRLEAIYDGFAALLSPGGDFLTLWTTPWSGEDAMQAAHGSLMTLLDNLVLAYAFIQSEGDDQSDDIITQLMLAELDQAIASVGGQLPEYLGTWETLPDVIVAIEGFLSEPFTLPVETGAPEPFELTVDVSTLFLAPVDDWKTKLPYMRWLTFAEWATHATDWEIGPYGWNPAVPYEELIDGTMMTFDDIGEYWIVESDWDLGSPVEFLDGPDGAPIGGGFPYFPDYTFGGLFPDMDREGWLTLLGIGG